MGKATDIHTVGAALYFLPVQTRVALKFGTETLTQVTCARARTSLASASPCRTSTPPAFAPAESKAPPQLCVCPLPCPSPLIMITVPNGGLTFSCWVCFSFACSLRQGAHSAVRE